MIALNPVSVVQAAPAAEPLTTDEAKAHLRVDSSAEDTYIDSLVKMARWTVEDLTGRSLITQTRDLWLDRWPRDYVIEIPRGPVQSVTSVVYYDTSDTEATFASSNYLVDTDSLPGRVILNDDTLWPTVTLRPRKAVRVRYVAGYGAASDLEPTDVHLVRLILTHAFENRLPVVTGTIATELPFALKQLILQNRRGW